ncbi:hypothetical protein PENSPDRAFT_652680 [Peniophora sp. CONT]|nr:hypothetical protein PENSPDRAFT_652680 [Peniophora sp. CONT]
MLHHSNRLHTLYLNDLYSEEIYAKGNVVERLLWPICKLPSLKSLSIDHYISTEKFIATAHHNWEFIEPLRPDGQPLEEWRFPPSLEKLELVITPFPWKCPIYDNLVDLSFISMHIDLADMIDLFSRMNRLEHLFFDRVGITYDVDVGEHPGLFELSDEEYERLLERVRRDFLEEQARSCLLPATVKTWSAVTHATAEFNPLLKLMGPSASTSLTVKLLGQPSILRNEVASFLSAHFPRLAGSHDMVLSAEFNMGIKRSSGDENKDTIRVRTVFSRTLDRDVTPDLVLEYAYTTKLNSDKGKAQQLPANYLLGIFKESGAELLSLEALPCFDTIVDLSLDCNFSYSREAWADALGLFPALVTLRIPENMLPDIMSTLAWYQSTIPEIHALHVRSSQQYGFKSSRSTVDMLIDWLISRKAGGSPLKDVRMPSALDAEMTACYGEGEWRSFLEK